MKQKTWQFKKRGVDKNNSREEKEGERTAGGAAMSGTTLKFKNLNSLSSSLKRGDVLHSLLSFLKNYPKSGTLVLPTEDSARMLERRSLLDLMDHDDIFFSR